MRINTNGTSFADSPDLTKAFMVTSCLKGCRTSLKVPSAYQHLALARMLSCSCLANIKCLRSFTFTSALKKPGGMQLSPNSKSSLSGPAAAASNEDGLQLLQYARSWEGLDSRSVHPKAPKQILRDQ